MKKLLIIAAIAAAGIGAYLFAPSQKSPASYNVLDYIPADTPIFSGQLEPFPLKDYLSSAPVMANHSEQQLLDDLYSQNNPKLDFFLNIFTTYQNSLKDPELLIKTFGFPEQLRGYFYTLGLLPVLKIEIENPQAVWDLLDKNELASGFMHSKGTLQSLDYRAYQLTDESDSPKIELIIAIDKGLLTVTLNTPYTQQSLLATALGLNKVENSLAASGQIEEILSTHNFKQSSVAFINHSELLKGFSTVNGNQLASHISTLEKQYRQTSPFAAIRNAQCESELLSIAANWPRTVFGYTEQTISAEQSTLAVAGVVESKNQTILKALKSIRGYIPEYVADLEQSLFAVGFGLDINQLAGSLNDILYELQTPSYLCQPLAELQNKLSQSGSAMAMLAMGASIANGVKGVSLGLFDYTIKQFNHSPSLASLDALLILSTDNPQEIFNSVKMFSPELQQVELSDNGEEIDLTAIFPIPGQYSLAPKLAIKGQQLLIYTGQKSQKIAATLSSEPLNKNGFFKLSLDFKKMFTPIATAAQLAGQSIPEEAMFLRDYDARMKMGIDINPQGIILDSYIHNKAAN